MKSYVIVTGKRPYFPLDVVTKQKKNHMTTTYDFTSASVLTLSQTGCEAEK